MSNVPSLARTEFTAVPRSDDATLAVPLLISTKVAPVALGSAVGGMVFTALGAPLGAGCWGGLLTVFSALHPFQAPAPRLRTLLPL